MRALGTIGAQPLIGVVALLVMQGSADTALAAPLAREIAVKVRVFEGNARVDTRLRRDPTLHRFVLADARRELTRLRRDAEAVGVEGLGTFNNNPWTGDLYYLLRADLGRHVSVIRRTLSFTGGAHPNTYLSTINWDRTATRAIGLGDMLTDTANDGSALTAVAELVRAAVAEEYRRRGDRDIDPTAQRQAMRYIEPRLGKLGAPSLAPSTMHGKASGITFHFEPYLVGGFADGVFVAFVPWRGLAPHLKPQARALFDGERPQHDEDTNEYGDPK